ncbi:MAG: COX15/CtaA family protein [Crocinitomicaceae bacterium]|nr:COX15/CtaA family protein [Crocinitomicaceae bacterium]
MEMSYSRYFVKLNWITLIFIYLVIIAGSFVRITGSGMGCPDWPKCFGQYIPPTDEKTLPADYKDIYASKRGKKIERFATMLEKVGFSDVAIKLRTDKTALIEQDFNPRKTWTEYVNRLVGMFAGWGVLLIFIAVLRKYRTRKLVLLSTINLVVLIFQAWFGSIVVATNLLPWTITLHLFLALVIVGLQLGILLEVSQSQRQRFTVPKGVYWVVLAAMIITFVQMFLGTQVREAIDFLVKQGYSRQYWVEHLGIPFFIHRSFSWLVLGMMGYLYWINRKGLKSKIINTSVYLLVLELTTGILLAYADMPGLVQTSHLLFASIMFGTLFMTCFRMSVAK